MGGKSGHRPSAAAAHLVKKMPVDGVQGGHKGVSGSSLKARTEKKAKKKSPKWPTLQRALIGTITERGKKNEEKTTPHPEHPPIDSGKSRGKNCSEPGGVGR